MVVGREPRDSVTNKLHGSSAMALQRKYSRAILENVRKIGDIILSVEPWTTSKDATLVADVPLQF